MNNSPPANHAHNPSQPPNGNTDNSNPPPNQNLPYWQINLPPNLHTPSCPPFLLNLSPKDQQTLTIPDAHYTPDSWATVKSRVAQNKLDEFKRIPSQLRKYLEYNYRLKQDPRYGSVQAFILKERLGWPEDGLNAKGTRPFECESDVKILRNDWPYGIDERIVHLVVWTKFGLEEEEEEGLLKREVRGVVDGWVRRRFTKVGGRGNAPGGDCVIWFKNWQSIKSIHAVEHFHVMLFDPDMGFVNEVTGGDVPLWEREECEWRGEVRVGAYRGWAEGDSY